jgi:hypothetical protein
MLLYLIFNISILLIFQFIFFRILNILNKINSTLIFFFFVLIFELIYFKFDTIRTFEFLSLNLSFIVAYYFFLTMLINDSPSLFLIENTREEFFKRNFVGDRIEQLQRDKLILKGKITRKGQIILHMSKILSFIFLKEKKS